MFHLSLMWAVNQLSSDCGLSNQRPIRRQSIHLTVYQQLDSILKTKCLLSPNGFNRKPQIHLIFKLENKNTISHILTHPFFYNSLLFLLQLFPHLVRSRIYSDIQTALKTINLKDISSKLISNCLRDLKLVSKLNKV